MGIDWATSIVGPSFDDTLRLLRLRTDAAVVVVAAAAAVVVAAAAAE
jgi:hypothetical protein